MRLWPFSRSKTAPPPPPPPPAPPAEDREKSDLLVPPLVYTFGSGGDGLPVGRMGGRYFGSEISTALRQNSAVMACVEWIRRVASSAELQVVGPDGEDTGPEVRAGQQALDLIRTPAPGIDPNIFLDALWTDLVTNGNAFWIIERGAGLRPMALRYLPPALVYPSSLRQGVSSQDYLSDTEPAGWSISISGKYGGLRLPEEMLRIRWSVDPTFPALGLTPLAAAARETMTDSRAADYANTVLSNYGFAGVIISPENQPFTRDVATMMRARWSEQLSGRDRGGVLVSQQPVKVHHPKPEGLSGIDLSAIRNLTEERVCALLGISPAVIGLGTGLEQTKIGATMIESVRLSWRQCLIPMQDMIAHQLTVRLMPEFGVDPAKAMFRFDRRKIQALQESALERTERLVAAVGGPYISLDEARAEENREPVEDGDRIRQHGEMPEMEPPAAQEAEEEEVEDEVEEDVEEEEAGKAADVEKARVPRLRADRSGLSRPQRTFIERQEVALWSHTRRAVREYATDFDTIEIQTRDVLEGVFSAPSAAQALAEIAQLQKSLPEGLSAEVTSQLLHLAAVGNDAVKAQVDALFELLGTTTDSAAAEIASTTGDHWTMALPGDGIAVTAVLTEVSQSVHDAWRRDRAGLIRRGLVKAADVDEILRLIVEADGNPRIAARNIAKHTTRGRWKTTLTRAKIIARTEAQWLQREAVIQTALKVGRKELEVIDGLLPSSDSHCVNLNGARVSVQEAQALHSAEHAQGTRDFIPAV